MDLIQTGKFIAELRKTKKLTQEQLGEILGVTNKTVSRWETGTYLPSAEALQAMSELFGVSISEILSGKKLTGEEYRAAAEENLRQTVRTSDFSLKEKMDFYQKKWLKEHVAAMCCWGICIAGAWLTGIVCKNVLLTVAGVILFVLGHAWRNNAMMTYVERKAFDETGNRS